MRQRQHLSYQGLVSTGVLFAGKTGQYGEFVEDFYKIAHLRHYLYDYRAFENVLTIILGKYPRPLHTASLRNLHNQ